MAHEERSTADGVTLGRVLEEKKSLDPAGRWATLEFPG